MNQCPPHLVSLYQLKRLSVRLVDCCTKPDKRLYLAQKRIIKNTMDDVPESTEESSASRGKVSSHDKTAHTNSPVGNAQASTSELENDATSFDLPNQSSPGQDDVPQSDDEDDVLQMVREKNEKKRLYNKRQYCLYCKKPYAKISKHLEQKHSKEPDVARAIGFPKNSKERQLHLKLLRNRGNLAHNTKVVQTGEGNLVLCKTPKHGMQTQDFAPCTFCQGLYKKKVLWRHVRMCEFRPDDVTAFANPAVGNAQASTSELENDATSFDLSNQGSPSQDDVPQSDDEDDDDDDDEVQQMVSGSGSEKNVKKRLYNKRQYCLYCKKPYSKISRHLERTHSKEPDVARAIGFPKNSKERQLHLKLLRNRGNLAHNAKVVQTGEGNLVACKTPKHGMQTHDFAPCTFCQGLFTKKVLWRHLKICEFRPDDFKARPGRNRVRPLCALPLIKTDISHFQKDFQEVVNQMTPDQVSIEVMKDKNIMRFGHQLYRKHRSSDNKDRFIRQRMRELGRLLLSAKKVTKNLKTLNDLIKPKNFMQTVKSVKDVAGCVEKTNTYKSPTLALNLGDSLSKIAELVESNARIEGDLDTAEAAGQFRHIYNAKWNELVSAAANRTLEMAQNPGNWDSPLVLPFTDDVRKLHSYLDDKSQEYYKALSTNASTENWANLTKVTLTKIILFNRWRSGEVSKMLLSSFIVIDQSEPNSEVIAGLSSLQQKLCNHFQRLEIRGDCDRKFALLLTPDMCKSLELLVEKRDACGVEDDNPYFFARPAGASFFRASYCLRHYAVACGAKSADNLCSPKYRDRVWTISKVLNLTSTELKQFLGFPIPIVHEQVYHLPEGTLQLAKICKVLLAFERGRHAELQGKTLDDIYIDSDEKVWKVVEEDEDDETDTEPGMNGGHEDQMVTMAQSVLTRNASNAIPGYSRQGQSAPRKWNRDVKKCKPASISLKNKYLKGRRLVREKRSEAAAKDCDGQQFSFMGLLENVGEETVTASYMSQSEPSFQSFSQPLSQSVSQSQSQSESWFEPLSHFTQQATSVDQNYPLQPQSSPQCQSTPGAVMEGPSTATAPQGPGRRRTRPDQGQMDSFESSVMSVIQQNMDEETLFLLSLAPRLCGLPGEKRTQVKMDFLASLQRAEFPG
ncbi:uncharacterized protein LOC134447434 isoform X2 [Engraulis encrasicolus]|uniref:uncharacterized protein LOC134447434 isoform X2 n=1 Tax=Engraulis encrasicolus TaxID=184585 RepID=UPI002FD483C6